MHINIEYIIDAYNSLSMGDSFFTPMFEKLIGVGYVREMIKAGYSAEAIEAMWSDDVERFKVLRREYLLYEESL